MPDAAKPATDEQMEAMRAAFAGTRTAMASLILIDGKTVTIASILARYDADAAEIKALREALREALVRAREFIQAEHDCLFESITVGGDPSTMDDVDAPHFAESLQALEEIDRALLEPSR
ncbi:hypothetical protein [Rhodovarius lipocyclicus]|uniref:hypothetical protein n=1 Tax=Rhodovarius lipocyclicus TaxID=268410 RepID=UPI001357D3CB|nr:hypothetical protein [Rhodovarius lipocyclicus]